jgi:hypothetical protein
MERAYVRFWGNDRAEHGMPTPYRSYLIFSTKWKDTPDGAIASIFPVSGELCLIPPHVPVEKGGERAALEQAIERLRAFAPNQGLSHHVEEY